MPVVGGCGEHAPSGDPDEGRDLDEAGGVAVHGGELEGEDERWDEGDVGVAGAQSPGKDDAGGPEDRHEDDDDPGEGEDGFDARSDHGRGLVELGVEHPEGLGSRDDAPAGAGCGDLAGNEEEGDGVDGDDGGGVEPVQDCDPGDGGAEDGGGCNGHLPRDAFVGGAQQAVEFGEGEQEAGASGYPAVAVDHARSIASRHGSVQGRPGVETIVVAPPRCSDWMDVVDEVAEDMTRVRE